MQHFQGIHVEVIRYFGVPIVVCTRIQVKPGVPIVVCTRIQVKPGVPIVVCTRTQVKPGRNYTWVHLG